MTEERRNAMVGHMEKMIHEFRIVVAGDGDVQGGFGHLPNLKSADLPTRLSNIERSTNQFRIVGNGINVSGDFDSGFILS